LTEIIPIDTVTLGDRSYLAHDGRVAVVIDPQRDIDRVLALAGQRGVAITHVFETHLPPGWTRAAAWPGRVVWPSTGCTPICATISLTKAPSSSSSSPTRSFARRSWTACYAGPRQHSRPEVYCWWWATM